MRTQYVCNLSGRVPYQVSVGNILGEDDPVKMIKIDGPTGELLIILGEENYNKLVALLVRAQGMQEEFNGNSSPTSNGEVGH